MTPSNPLHYPRWIRLDPESAPILVQSHHHHSAITGQQFDADAQPVIPKGDEPVVVPPVPVMTSGLSVEEEEAQIAAAAGEIAIPHIPTEEEAEDLGRPVSGLGDFLELAIPCVEEDAGSFVPVDDDELAEMFAKPAPEPDGEPKAKRTRKVRE